ncbi:YadA-like family protein [Veillonella sp. CHU740]|uniref:YadA-like family protein n=1 Tax=Veillonella sp. CHU740 TaxID=2490950 RepID=UPI00197DE719|nr:YadA-like family protein [Veillonella sp. CHU740]
MKGISGNGTDPLTIKNGDNAVITVKPGANGAKGEVDFGGSKLTNIGTPGANTDAANKAYVDTKFGNAANKDLGNLSDDGKNAVKDLAAEAVKVAQGKNVTVTPKTTDHVTTYTVDAIDTTVAAGEGLSVTGGDTVDTATNKRNYTVALSQDTKDTLAKVSDIAKAVGTNGVDGRDGKPGTGADAGMGKDGLTKEDGLNGKDLTTKVNALRNGEAGTVVYTDENGKRVVKAKDGKWYLADKVDATGNKLDGATEVTTPQARLVNPDGTTTGGTTKLSNIADGEIAAGSHDAVTGGQLHTKLAEKADKSVVDNLTTTVNTNTTDIAGLKTTVDKAITFKGDDDQGVERKLDTTLTVKGATNFTPSATTPATEAGVNIRVEKDPTTNANGLVVKLADTLTNMKGISGNGTDPLTIKNGDNAVITVKPGAAGAKGDVDFGGSKLTNVGAPGTNTDAANKFYVDEAIKAVNQTAAGNANLGYKANGGTAKSVAVTTGLDFVQGDGTANTAESAKSGIEIVAGDSGKVIIGLSNDAKTKLDKVNDIAKAVGANGVDGRDGKPGTGADAGMGKDGLTAADGLNGKDLTTKVNALRNGEAGSVVYTDENGNRVVKANDGKWYPANKVNADGTKAADATEVTKPQARLVNPDGTTTGGTTKLSNIADGEIKAGSKDAINGGQLHDELAKKADVTALAGKVDKASELHVKADTYAVGDDGIVTVKQEDGTGAEATGKEFKISGLATKTDITNINTTLNNKANASDLEGLKTNPITFTGDDAQNVTRALGTTLTVKGATNFTPSATTPATEVGVNIRVEKDPTTDANGLVVKLADTLTNMKGISGNGTDPLKIKNGDNAVITVKPGAAGAKGDVDFGGSKLTNVGAPGANTDAANKFYVDEAIKAVNQTAAGNANLGYTANGGTAKTVAVTTGLDFVQGDGTANTAESAKSGIEIVAGDSGKVIIGLSEDAKTKLDKVNDIAKAVGANGVDGRDGKPGTGADAGMGKDGLTKEDGLNGKDLTTKVNALRNGEAGSVVYTDENGNRVVKANDGKWYPAGKVNADGTKAADATEVTKPQARLVNPDGTTTGGTTVFNNVASAIPAAAADGSKPTVLDNLNTAANNDKTKHAAVNVSDLNNTATEIIAKGLTFQGNDAKGIKKQLGETLDIVGEGTVATGATTAANNIRTKKTDDGKLEIGLAKDLVGIASVTNATTTDGAGTKLALDGDKLTITNTQPLPEGVAPGTAPTMTTVTIGKDGINAGNKVISNVATPNVGTDAANKDYVDTQVGNAANKDLGNLSDDGKNAVKDLAAGAVKVAAGKNVAVAPKTTDHVTTYTVDAIDTKVEAGEGLSVTGGDTVDTATNTRNYTVALSQDTKDTLAKVQKAVDAIGTNGSDGRDGKPGTGADAGMGKDGLTKEDGLNGKDLTTKVNALRNGEAGSVVYTDENGNRVVKANDGKWYPAEKVDAKGNKLDGATEVATPQARLVNPDGTTTGGTTKLSNIADGEIKAGSKDAINGGQLHTELAKKADVTALNELADKPLTFSGDTGTNATRKLGETLAVKGAANFTPAATATPGVNIQVASDPTNGLTVSLADTLTGMKGISGNGTDPLTIKNGDNAVITVKPGADGAKGDVDFGGSKLTNVGAPGANTDAANKFYVDEAIKAVNQTAAGNANLGYKANGGTAKTVAVTTGLDFVQGDGTANTAESAKSGIEIVAGDNGKVTFGLNEATRNAIDNAANKDLGNLSDNGKNAVKDLAAGAVKVAAGKNVAVTPKTTDHVTTYTVDAIDTTVAAGDGLEVTGGAEDTNKVRAYTVGLSADTKAKLAKVENLANTVGTIGADGRDGKAGTGKDPKATDAVAGDKGLTGQDGLNGKDLTSKVNALRNGEAGTVVYTDENGNRLAKANDGQYYPANKVNADGTKADDAVAVATPQARLVNPNGTTTGGTTKLSNIADGTIGENSKDAINGGQLHTELAKKADKSDITTINNTLADKANASDLNTLAEKPLTFSADTGTNAARKLGETLAVKGAANFTPSATATPGVNIQVASDPTNGLTVSLADTLTNMKGISGNGTDNLVIKNGTNTITVTPGKAEVKDDQGTVTTPADPGKVNFGDATVTVKDLEAPITYRANSVADTAAKSVSLKKGLDFVTGDGTTATAEAAKAGLHIETGDDGKVIIGLSDDAKAKLDKVNDIAKTVGANGVDGRDGKPGTGADAGMGKDGLTAEDGLNGKDLTTKVNALRNGEAGSVVYTDENGNRVVKANDGKWYPANKVNADGTKAADAVEVTKPQARLVNPDGTTAGGTTVLNNVASAIPNTAKDDANQPIANPTFLDRLNTAAGDAKTQNAAVNVSDLNNTAKDIIAKGLTFQGNDKQGIKKQLGETLDIVGEGTVPATATTAANNIRTKKADNKLEIGLAKDLVGITSITNAATTDGAGTKLALDGNNLTITNTQAVPENAPAGTVPTVTTVTIGKDGINAGGKVISNVAAPKANTDAVNKEYVDTKVGEATAAATGNAKIGYKANAETETKKVGVADGLHFKSGTGTIAPTDLAPNTSPTKDTDSKEAKTGIAITTEENGVVNIGLDEATRKVIDSAAKLGDTATDGRDGKAGTGKAADDATAVAGDKGLTGKDGLNGQDLTSKVNALRNGEAGTVVYTDDKGNRVVKANDGKWYDAKAVTDKGELKPADQLPQGVTATPVDAPQARLVNPDGTTTAAEGATGTKLSNIADGTIGENSKDAINGGQLHTELAKKADVTALNELADKALTFSTDTGTDATRKLGTTLAVKGAANFTPAATATPGVNIQVASDPTNGLTVSLADTLTEMKGISGNGTDPLTIKNGDNAVITVNPGANGAKGDVDFGGSKLTNIGEPGANTDAANKAYVDSKVGDVANLGYKANNGTAKQVAVGTGLNFVQGDGTANTAESAKAGIEIVAGDDGKVTFGLNEATRNAIDNAANKDLGNLSDNGKNAVKDLAAGAVKVAAGKNVAVTPKTTDHVTTYTVDAIDTKVIKGDGIEVTGGDEDTDKVRTYTVALSQATKDTLAKVADIAKAVGADGANGIDGRDGKSGTGNNAGMGKDGLTGADGLNGKDLTTKVNALRNGEAGSVVYTDENGNRVVKASDGKWYPADKVKADGTKADDAVEVKTPQARLVNPDGSTTGGTTVINNVASAIPNTAKDGANQPIANPTFLDRLNTAAGDVNTKHAAVNVSDLNNTATEIIAKGLTFEGNDEKAVTRALGTTLTVKGAKNFTPSATTPATEAGVNIRVEKDSTTDANGLVVKLADTLTDMKGISGNGTDNLVIKNGTNTITVTPGKAADGATKADPGKVNFGDATVTVKDLDAPITYRTNGDADEKAKTVSLKQGLDFVTGDGTTNTAESAKPGLNIVTGENGKVIIGLSGDAATKLGKVDGIAAKVDAVEKALDNKADKSTVEDLANKLADKADKATVKDLADKVDGKADKSTVADLAKTVEGKADKSELDKKADKGEVTALANKAMTFTGNNAEAKVERKLGETLHLVGTNNITVEKDATKEGTLNVTLASTLTGMESITTKAVDGLSNTTWDPTKVASAEEAKAKPDSDAAKERSKAATQGQLKDVADRVSKGRVFTADTKDGKDPLKAEVGLGDTLAIQGGATGELTDKNIGVELAPAKDGKPATMTVKLAKDLNMADGKSKYDRYLPEFEKTDKGLLKLDAKGNPIPKKDKDGNVILQKDGNGNPIVNSSTVVNGNGTTYTINNLLSNGTVQVDNDNKPVAGVVTTTTAAGTRYEERLTTEDGHVIFKQDDNTKELKPVLKTVSVVDSRGIRIGSNDKPVVSLTKDGLNNGGNTISNVAPGVYESDAATVGQLNAATNTVTAKVNEAGAHAAALAAMNPLSYDPLKKSQVMAGVGAYKGNKALALGVAHYANEDTMFNVGVSVGGGSNMMNAGVTYRFGGEDSMIPERYKGGPISSVYILQDEVSALKAENAQVKADNEQVKADNARMKENYEKVMQDNEEMKAQIKMLMAHMGIK